MDNIFDVIRKKIRDRRDRYAQSILRGSPKDFVEYKELSARVNTCDTLLDEITKLENDIMVKEEL